MQPKNTTNVRKGRLTAIGAVLSLSMVVLLALLAVATAGAAPAGGRVALLATFGAGPSGKILIAGAIGDWGSSTSIDRNGKPDANGNFLKVKLRKGTFEINGTALNKATANPHPQVASDATCSVGFTGSAPAPLFNGTGLYRGIAGTINITLTFTGVGARYKTGPHKGQCEHNDHPLAMLGTAIGHGIVQFK